MQSGVMEGEDTGLAANVQYSRPKKLTVANFFFTFVYSVKDTG